VCRASLGARHRVSSKNGGHHATAFDDNVLDINALLHPGTIFDHPRDVPAHPSLLVSEKRAILASWASDASAIASCPALLAPAGLKAPVTIDEILEALCELDGGKDVVRDGNALPDRLTSFGPLALPTFDRVNDRSQAEVPQTEEPHLLSIVLSKPKW
jgi:hypothetical protein